MEIAAMVILETMLTQQLGLINARMPTMTKHVMKVALSLKESIGP
jgi:hypothetical protein